MVAALLALAMAVALAVAAFCAAVAAVPALVALPAAASADEPQPFAMTVVVGENATPVRALQDAYAGNLYLSLRDLSAALREVKARMGGERK